MRYHSYQRTKYRTKETGAQSPTTNPEPELPEISMPSPTSPVALPNEPNPEDKPNLIILYQEINRLYEDALKELVNVGYLTTQSTTAYGTKPVANARITISKPIGNGIFLAQVVKSDADGKTPPIPLPSRNAELSQTPGFPVPYTVYNVSASAPGYRDVDIYDIPIFPGITSIQPINFIPIAQGSEREANETK